MKINDIITKDGKEYKFVCVLEELQQKGMSSCALCDYRSHISVCEFGIKNMCLPNHCLKLNEQPIHPEHKEAINVLRTIRAVIDCVGNEKQFKKHIISILHKTDRGCIGCDKDIVEELIKYELPKESE